MTPTPQTQTAGPLAWTATVIATAAIFLLAFNARALSTWLADKEPTPQIMQARTVADAWTATMASVGLDKPHTAIRALWALRKPAAEAER